jgi:nicotinamidase-related amidase
MTEPALLLIDVQKAFDDPCWGERNNPDAESNIALLLSAWREQNLPVIHVRHCSTISDSPLQPDMPGNEFKDEARPLPGEKQFSKTVNSAFIGTGLEAYLHETGISSLAIVGLTTDHCVSTSTRMASNLGFDATLISDATATFERKGFDGVMYSADVMHQINLVSLSDEFCTIRSTKELLAELEERHPS